MDDKNKVINVIDKYIEGTRIGDVTLLKELFYENAIMGGDLPHTKIVRNIFQNIDGNKSESNYSSDISDVKVFKEIAFVTLKEYNLQGANFINHFHLQKIKDTWKIVSKLFTTV